MQVIEILQSKFPSCLLSGFKNGWFDNSDSTLFGYSIFRANDEDFKWYLPSISGYGSVGPKTDDERLRISSDGDSFTNKELPQLIEDGIFNWCSVEFFGVLYKNDWYCLPQFTFYEDGSMVDISAKIESDLPSKKQRQDYCLKPVPEFESDLDIEKISAIYSEKMQEPIDFIRDFEKVRNLHSQIPYDELPKKQIPQSESYRPFIGMPWIVANEKLAAKQKLNYAYEAYVYLEIVRPLASALIRLRPHDFHEIHTISNGAGMFRLIYPQTKKYLLGAIPYRNGQEMETVFYFVYIKSLKKIYQWILPPQKEVYSYFGFVIEEDFLEVGLYLANSDGGSVTIDDTSFWDTFVFKKEGEDYLYLKPIAIENPQPDIFTQW